MATPTKNWKEDLQLLGVLFGATVFHAFAGLPRALGFSRRTFVIGGRTVTRPETFSGRPQKAAFEEVGQFLAQSGPDELRRFRDDEILRNPYGYRDLAPLDVWHEVLAWFVAEGHLVSGWALRFPTGTTSYGSVPGWDRDGEKRSWWDPASWPDGVRPPFCPWLLTDAERDALVGEAYATQERSSVTDPSCLPRRPVEPGFFVRSHVRVPPVPSTPKGPSF